MTSRDLELLELQNDLTLAGARERDARRENAALREQLAHKEQEYKDYARTRLQLGQKLQSILLENGELRDELDTLKQELDASKQELDASKKEQAELVDRWAQAAAARFES